MKFTIKRSIWLRGKGVHDSYLLRGSDGKMCCVGQVCQQLGICGTQLTGKRTASEVAGLFRSDHWRLVLLTGRGGEHHEWVLNAYEMNDNVCYEDAERERELSALFAASGHELVFED